MIYIIIGTKGQFMKMFPVMKLMDKKNISYRFIHMCQHYGIIEINRKRLHLRKPDIYLTTKKRDLANIVEMFFWVLKVLWNARKLSISKSDYVIVHGDAESTFLSFLIGKWFGAKIVHIESGIRSGSYFEPFPEEIIRSIVSRYSDYSFCPTAKDAATLEGKKNIFVTGGNTAFDSVRLALQEKPSELVSQLFGKKYVIFSVHRKENLMNMKRSSVIMRILEMILAKGFIVVWPIHANTEYELKEKGLWNKMMELKRRYPLHTQYFFDYVDFMHAVKNAVFVATDGGGLQNESYVLNTPMLILRKVLEMDVGLGETAFLSLLDTRKVTQFLDNISSFRRRDRIVAHPSEVIVKTLATLSRKEQVV